MFYPESVKRFTKRALYAATSAHMAAQELNHHTVRTDHILLGILRENGGIARSVLLDLESSPGVLEKTLLADLPLSSSPLPPSEIDAAQETKMLVELARDEARRRKNLIVGTEHLLLGMMHQKNTGAYKAILKAGFDPRIVETKLEALINSSVTDDPLQDAVDFSWITMIAVLSAAQDEAQLLKNATVAPEHLLWALRKIEYTPVLQMLEYLKTDDEHFLFHIRKIRRDTAEPDHIPSFTHEAQIFLRQFNDTNDYESFTSKLLKHLLYERWALADFWTSLSISPDQLQKAVTHAGININVMPYPKDVVTQFKDIARAYGLHHIFNFIKRLRK